MSIVVDGVTLPDLPSEFLEVYPYVTMLKIKMDYSDALNEYGYQDVDTYSALLSTKPTKVSTVNNSFYMLVQGSYKVYAQNEGIWEENGEFYNPEWYVEDITSFEIEGTGSVVYSVVWSNFTLMQCEMVDENTVIDTDVYLDGAGVIVPPDELAVNRDFLVNLGLHARRLSGTQIPLETSEILEKFVAIEATELEDAEGMEF